MIKIAALLGAATALSAAVPAAAAVTVYTNAAEFTAAAGGAASVATETFNSFTSDTSFRNTPLALTGFTVRANGTNDETRNKIDVTPYSYSQYGSGTNSTPLLNGYVNAGTSVVFTFNAPIKAFGGDFSQIANDTAGGKTADTNIVFDMGGTTQAFANTTTSTFYGFVSDTAFTTVTIRMGSNNVPDGFGIDNLRFSANAVPEPATWAMMLVGFAGVGATLRRRARRVAHA